MQAKHLKEAEGVIALRKLQNNGFELWTKEEIENSNLPDKSKQICFYIAKRNSLGEIPSKPEIIKSLKLGNDAYARINVLKDKEIVFDLTIPEIVGFYDLSYLGFRSGRFHPPQHLKCLKKYLDEFRSGHRGGKSPWYQIIRPENVRNGNYSHHLVANLKDKNGLPCYLPLGLHVPKQ